MLGLLGPNGAGKTTAVRILTTLLRPDGGGARVAGLDVVAQAAELRSRIGLAGQYAAVDENLTGAENLEMVGRLYHLPRGEPRARAAELLERFDLDRRRRPPRPHLLGRDAPPARPGRGAGRPPARPLPRRADHRARPAQPDRALGDDRGAGRASGTTVLLTTQYLDEADRLADRIAVIDHGRVIADGSADELKDQVGGERLDVTLEDDTRPRRPSPRCARSPRAARRRDRRRPLRAVCASAAARSPRRSAASTRPGSGSPTWRCAARPSTTSSSP